MRDDFLVFGSPRIEEAEIAEVVACLRSGWIGTGPRVRKFEQAFCAYKGISHAAALNSATAGLHLSCLALGLGPGDEVITTAMTFCATVNAIIHSGATPVLADIDPETGNIDAARIAEKITSRTKALLIVHLAGRPCDMDALMKLAKERHLFVIEDCAHAIETKYHGVPAGTMGDCGVFSFYVTKNMTTSEGGMVVSRNKDFISRIKMLALHGMSLDAWQRFSDKGYKHYFVEAAGFKYNMTDLQAALGIRQLERVDEYWKRREEIWQRYMDAFSDIPLTLPAGPSGDIRHAYHLFQLGVGPRAGLSRDEFIEGMTERKIGVGVHYSAIPEHPYYQRTFGWRPEDCPAATAVGRQTVSIPLSAKLTDEDVQDVISAVRDLMGA